MASTTASASGKGILLEAGTNELELRVFGCGGVSDCLRKRQAQG